MTNSFDKKATEKEKMFYLYVIGKINKNYCSKFRWLIMTTCEFPIFCAV